MSTEKQTHDALATLGTIIDEHQRRDAIHIAVEPAVAAHTLRPGEHVGFIDGWVGISSKPVGIVDPFLKEPVAKGQRFWLFVYPRTITSLRHAWTHPEFKDEAPATRDSAPSEQAPTEEQVRASEEWLRNFISLSDCPDYDTVIAAATDQHHLNDRGDGYNYSENTGDRLHFNGDDAHGEIPDEFWDHVEIVSGMKIPQSRRASYFSCSC